MVLYWWKWCMRSDFTSHRFGEQTRTVCGQGGPTFVGQGQGGGTTADYIHKVVVVLFAYLEDTLLAGWCIMLGGLGTLMILFIYIYSFMYFYLCLFIYIQYSIFVDIYMFIHLYIYSFTYLFITFIGENHSCIYYLFIWCGARLWGASFACTPYVHTGRSEKGVWAGPLASCILTETEAAWERQLDNWTSA